MEVGLEQILKKLRWARVATSPDVLIAFMAYLTFGDKCIDPEKLYEVSKPLLDNMYVDWWSFKFHLEWVADNEDCYKLSYHYYEKAREVLQSFVEEKETIEVIARR